MIDFKKLTINDIEIIRPYFKWTRSNNCDNTIGGSVMWADFFNTRYAIVEKTLVFKVTFFDYGECYTVPIGESANHILDLICENYFKNNMPVQFVAATERDLAFIEKKFKVEKLILPEWSDYVYEASDLINFTNM